MSDFQVKGDAMNDLIATGQALAPAAPYIEALLRSALGQMKEFHDKADLFGRAAKLYKTNLERQIGHIRIIGMDAPVPLRNLFVKVNILDKLTSKQVLTVQQLEAYFDKDKGSFGKISTPCKLGMDVIRSNDYVTVLGKPGSGKTTFLKYIAMCALTNQEGLKSIPVFVPLKQLNDDTLNIVAHITDHFRTCGFEKPRECIENLLKSGSLTILFDGLDEVENNQDGLITKLQQFIDKYHKCKYVLSCRSAAYNYVFTQFTDVEIADFDTSQIEAFASKWFADQATKRRLFVEEIKDPDNKPMLELARSPLLLTLLCINYDDGMSFPVNRADLYDDAIEALLKKWDTHRQIKRPNVYRALSTIKKRKLFKQLAKHTFADNEYFFRKDRAIALISEILEKMGTGVESPEFDGGLVLESIEAQHGIVVQRAKGVYSFAHLTFQEYFTAAAICENTNFEGRNELIDKYMFEDRWREVFLLVTSKLDDGDDFLRAIRKKISSLPIGKEVTNILSKVSNSLNHRVNYPLPIKRTLAFRVIFDAGNYRGADEGYFINNSEIRWARRATEALLERILEIYRSSFTEEIEKAEIEALDLGLQESRDNLDNIAKEIGGLDDKHFKAFARYLNASKLLIDCMSVDAMVSKQVKKELIESFLVER